MRATDTLYSTTAQFSILRAPTTSDGTSFGPGTENNLLKSNGTNIYWTTLAASDIPTISITDKTSGTLTVERGGTGQTSIANIQAGKDGDGNTISSTYLKLEGGDLTGDLGIIFGDTDKFLNFWYNTNKTAGASWRLGVLGSGSSDTNYFVIQSGTSTTSSTTWNNAIRIGQNTYDITVGGNLYPLNDNKTLGTSSHKWSNVYATTFTGNLTGNVTGNVSGTSANVTGTIAVGHGGTGFTEYIKGDLLYASNTNTLSKLSIGTKGYYLNSTADGPVWRRPQLYFGTCDSAAADTTKEVTCDEYDTLTIGDLIVVKFSITNTGAVDSLKLKVNETDAIAIKKQYHSNSTAQNLSHASELNNSTIALFCYNGTYWIYLNGDYNTTYTIDNSLVSGGSGANITAETSANGGVGLRRYSLMMMTTNQTWSAISHVSGSTAANQGADSAKVAATANFLLNSPILYTSTNAYVAPGNGANLSSYTASALNLRYSIGIAGNTAPTLTIQKPVYLVGIVNSDNSTFKLDSTQWWTQTLPTSNDGKIYILLGLAYSASNIYLNTFHPIFYHNGTCIMPYTPGTIPVEQGGTNATTATGARTNLGLGEVATYNLFSNSSPWWATSGRVVPTVGTDGAIELGKYIDFHSTREGTTDYDVRITASTTGLSITGTTSGTFSGSLNGINFITNTGSLASNGWEILGGQDTGLSLAVSYNTSPAAWNSGTYSSTIVFGGNNTKGYIDCAYNTPVVTIGGSSINDSTNDAPTWYFKLSGTSAQTYDLNNLSYIQYDSTLHAIKFIVP